ncbi:MAG: anhydro-N-acetylmuramic acid kinase [Bacteroidetes bacterium]|nr:MAG: anhydro-N-acetylmuramic acid kinase [Bacteroidota bacterium]MBL1144056.1 anhydro-N-acetylmuramic acid kinase [Bacteroidota bacterium]NOG56856.1 anhydro-N-acetylmuramic acid kinase [Bacteroidota bacterium]
MSGTSLDGLDLCYAHFYRNTEWEFDIKYTDTIPYSTTWKNKLSKAHDLNGESLALLHVEFGQYIGKQSKAFMIENNLKPELIASHGHTVFHQPDKNFTLQIGHGAEIAAITGVKTCCDFRTTDMAYQGQGAPLVPIGDLLLFKDFQACINLGGFCNVSIKSEPLIAYDICPANIVLNELANQLNLEFDFNGENASKGNTCIQLLNELDSLAFFAKQAPKSLGREWLESEVLPILNKSIVSTEDKLNTFSKHIANQIAQSLANQHVKSPILITGGGAKNNFLMDCIKEKGLKINRPDVAIIDYKEALIFGFLGLLRNLETKNTLSSVTGAKKDSIGGCIFLP